ncbi:hypothetical protein TNCV_2655661 [Trichonephila clavipes]|nr:hypothetical protein TNCV_2655661 [Trichonephila clavipes]
MWPQKFSGYGHELVAGVSRVRVLVPLKIRRVAKIGAPSSRFPKTVATMKHDAANPLSPSLSRTVRGRARWCDGCREGHTSLVWFVSDGTGGGRTEGNLNHT